MAPATLAAGLVVQGVGVLVFHPRGLDRPRDGSGDDESLLQRLVEVAPQCVVGSRDLSLDDAALLIDHLVAVARLIQIVVDEVDCAQGVKMDSMDERDAGRPGGFRATLPADFAAEATFAIMDTHTGSWGKARLRGACRRARPENLIWVMPAEGGL